MQPLLPLCTVAAEAPTLKYCLHTGDKFGTVQHSPNARSELQSFAEVLLRRVPFKVLEAQVRSALCAGVRAQLQALHAFLTQ